MATAGERVLQAKVLEGECVLSEESVAVGAEQRGGE